MGKVRPVKDVKFANPAREQKALSTLNTSVRLCSWFTENEWISEKRFHLIVEQGNFHYPLPNWAFYTKVIHHWLTLKDYATYLV